ncbi:MAG: FGGY family carbohydrate kinase [Alphaproteobacteria bacterium]
MADIIVGIDAGTSVIKAVAFADDGRQLGVAAEPNVYQRVGDGGYEQDPAETWTKTAAVLRRLAESVPDLGRRTLAIAVTGQGDGTWLIDDAGTPTAPGWLWLDARAAALADRRRALPEDRERFLITGTGFAACQMGAQLAYMDETMPGLLDRSATAFHCKDWLYFLMTGRRATDPTEGLFTFGSYRTLAYSDEVVRLLGLSHRRGLLPEIVDGTRQYDPLSERAAAEIGIPAGTPVVLAYVDALCTCVGGGLYDPDCSTGLTIIGSTGLHVALVDGADKVRLNPDSTGWTMKFPVPGFYAQLQSNMAATLNIDWLLDLAVDVLASAGVRRSRADQLIGIDDLVLGAAPGRILYQPHISDAGERGPFVDPHARAGFVGLDSGHRYADLMRAVFEGLALAARNCYGAMGPLPGEIRVSGGAARSVALRQIIGAAVGASVRGGGREEAGAAGAAMMAAVCLGVYPDMAACADAWVGPWLGALEPPDPALTEVYARLYPAYVGAQRAMIPIWRQLAEARGAADA